MQVELFDFVHATVGVQEEIAFVFKREKNDLEHFKRRVCPCFFDLATHAPSVRGFIFRPATNRL